VIKLEWVKCLAAATRRKRYLLVVKSIDAGYKDKIEFGKGPEKGTCKKENGEEGLPLPRFVLSRSI
jgi:hypothetical protein